MKVNSRFQKDIAQRLHDRAAWMHRVCGASIKRSIYTEAACEIERLRLLLEIPDAAHSSPRETE